MDVEKLRDQAGHSALWFALSFCHVKLSIILLEEYAAGWDYLERHERRNETMLHL